MKDGVKRTSAALGVDPKDRDEVLRVDGVRQEICSSSGRGAMHEAEILLAQHLFLATPYCTWSNAVSKHTLKQFVLRRDGGQGPCGLGMESLECRPNSQLENIVSHAVHSGGKIGNGDGDALQARLLPVQPPCVQELSELAAAKTRLPLLAAIATGCYVKHLCDLKWFAESSGVALVSTPEFHAFVDELSSQSGAAAPPDGQIAADTHTPSKLCESINADSELQQQRGAPMSIMRWPPSPRRGSKCAASLGALKLRLNAAHRTVADGETPLVREVRANALAFDLERLANQSRRAAYVVEMRDGCAPAFATTTRAARRRKRRARQPKGVQALVSDAVVKSGSKGSAFRIPAPLLCVCVLAALGAVLFGAAALAFFHFPRTAERSPHVSLDGDFQNGTKTNSTTSTGGTFTTLHEAVGAMGPLERLDTEMDSARARATRAIDWSSSESVSAIDNTSNTEQADFALYSLKTDGVRAPPAHCKKVR